MVEKRLEGLDALKAMVEPIRGKIRVARFDMINPKVQFHSDVALLTFNLMSYDKQADGTEKLAARWNSTETYRRFEDGWKIIHSHWSFIKPQLSSESNKQN